MQIDRFPCKFDSYSIGINFGLPKVKRKAARLQEPMKAKEWGFAPNEDKKTCLSLVLCPSSLLLVRRFCTLGKNNLKTRHCVFLESLDFIHLYDLNDIRNPFEGQ